MDMFSLLILIIRCTELQILIAALWYSVSWGREAASPCLSTCFVFWFAFHHQKRLSTFFVESFTFCEFVVRKIEMSSRNSRIFDWAVQNEHKGAFTFGFCICFIFWILCKWLRSCELGGSLYSKDWPAGWRPGNCSLSYVAGRLIII